MVLLRMAAGNRPAAQKMAHHLAEPLGNRQASAFSARRSSAFGPLNNSLATKSPGRYLAARHAAHGGTQLLASGVPVQVVAQRLGHKNVNETLNTYAHALPDMQRDAAAKLGAVLYG